MTLLEALGILSALAVFILLGYEPSVNIEDEGQDNDRNQR